MRFYVISWNASLKHSLLTSACKRTATWKIKLIAIIEHNAYRSLAILISDSLVQFPGLGKRALTRMLNLDPGLQLCCHFSSQLPKQTKALGFLSSNNYVKCGIFFPYIPVLLRIQHNPSTRNQLGATLEYLWDVPAEQYGGKVCWLGDAVGNGMQWEWDRPRVS